MTDKQRTALKLFADGKSYADIGRELGCSRQNAFAMVRDAVMGNRGINFAKYPYYPRLVEYIFYSGGNITKFARSIGLQPIKIYGMLKDGREVRYDVLRLISKHTGLTIDELLEEVHDETNEDVQQEEVPAEEHDAS